jgi:hypothetical protein
MEFIFAWKKVKPSMDKDSYMSSFQQEKSLTTTGYKKQRE